MSKLTKFLELLKGEENDFFEYNLYLNDNWDKIDRSIQLLNERDTNVYLNDFNVAGDALYTKPDKTLWADSLFRLPATDNYDSFISAIRESQLKKSSLYVSAGKYFISKEIHISNINTDFVFEKGATIIGNVRISDLKNVTFKDLSIKGDLYIDSIENCKFLNLNVTGNTYFGITMADRNCKFNYFINCNFTSGDNVGFKFYCENLVKNNSKQKIEVSDNTFINCSITGLKYGIYAEVNNYVENAEISHNLFLNCRVTSTDKDSTAILLGRYSEAFHFIQQKAKGYYSMNVSSSNGRHIFSGGILDGIINDLNKFLIYKPSNNNGVNLDQIGNNINETRKMKVYNNVVPNWDLLNVKVTNDNTTKGFTGDDCLKIITSDVLSFSTLERVFKVSEHLNQPLNVVARVKVNSTTNTKLADGAIILTNDVNENTVTMPIKPDNSWSIVSAKIDQTMDKNITVKFTPNNSYTNNNNELFIDWIIIALGESVQYSSVPPEEHHYKNLDHYGDLSVIGNLTTKDLKVDRDLYIDGKVFGDLEIENGNVYLLKQTEFNNSADVQFDIGSKNPDSVKKLSTFKYKIKVEGNQDNQVLKIYAVTRQSDDSEKLEEILKLSKENIFYKDKELHHDNNALGAGSDRPENPKIGRQFYDTYLKQPIWFDGLVWRDANKNKV